MSEAEVFTRMICMDKCIRCGESRKLGWKFPMPENSPAFLWCGYCFKDIDDHHVRGVASSNWRGKGSFGKDPSEGMRLTDRDDT